MSNLKPLVWHEQQGRFSTKSPITEYEIVSSGDKYKVYYTKRRDNYTREATGFVTVDDAKAWAWNHYNEKMQPYINEPKDTITDIKAWFQAAKPEPTDKDVATQVGCHFEEVSEMNEAILGVDTWEINNLANHFKYAPKLPKDTDHLGLLDSLCDQIVTATGVAYMMGFDIEGALKEVIRSNNSKMVDGEFEFDDNGKIMKPESYSEPDLTPFISTMQNLHKGE